jgi:hypothetical protein
MPKHGSDRDVNPLAIAKEKCEIEVRFLPYVMENGSLRASESGIGLLIVGAVELPGDIHSFRKARKACVETKLQEQRMPEATQLPPLVLDNAPKPGK